MNPSSNPKNDTENSTPRKTGEKKGLMRMIELLDRDSGKFFKSGLLAVLALVPFIAALVGAVGYGMPLLLIACIPAGMLAAPEIAAVADTVMRSQRDEIGWWWWDSYKKGWKQNAKASLLPGGIFGLVAGLMIYSLYVIAALENPVTEFWMLLAAVMVLMGVTVYYLPMLVCMELPFPTLLRNCFVLFFCHPIKSLLAALVQVLYYGLILVWFPLTSVIFIPASVWMPMLAAYVIIYPALDKHFGLKEAYEKLQKERWEG